MRNKLKKRLKYFLFISVFWVFALMNIVNASEPLLQRDTVTGIERQNLHYAQMSNTNQSMSIGKLISKGLEGFLTLLAIIFIILIIYSGYNWMTAQGDEQKVTKAKETIQKAIIGLVVIVSAYSIAYFVFKIVNPFVFNSRD